MESESQWESMTTLFDVGLAGPVAGLLGFLSGCTTTSTTIRFDYSTIMAFGDNKYLWMFVRRHCQNEAAHSNTRPSALRFDEQNNNRTYWRSDSINIYHNHKIKLFSKSIACDPIGGSVLSGRDLGSEGVGPETNQKRAKEDIAAVPQPSQPPIWVRIPSIYFRAALISAEITAGQAPIKSPWSPYMAYI